MNARSPFFTRFLLYLIGRTPSPFPTEPEHHVGAHHVSTNPANRVLVHPPRRSRPGIAASKRNIFLVPGPSRIVEHPGSDIA